MQCDFSDEWIFIQRNIGIQLKERDVLNSSTLIVLSQCCQLGGTENPFDLTDVEPK